MDLKLYFDTDIELIAYGALVVLLVLQLYYILFIYSKLSRYKVKSFQENENLPPASVIICASNEESNLKKFLDSILQQDYPNFEVIVVDDHSTDDSKWLLKKFKKQYSNLYVVEIKEHIRLKHSKKFALTLGIKAAKYEHLVLTDADCEPASNLWLREMVGAYNEETEIVLGYSPYFKQKGFLNKLIRFETTHTAMSYLSYALKHNTYMGVGRNLSYLKTLFFKGKGFNTHMHIKSGDDDLFVNQNATSQNVNIAIHKDAHVYSIPKTTWKAYNKQKARHASASVAYKKKHQFMLGLQLITAILFYITLFATFIFYPKHWQYSLGIFFVRSIVQLIAYMPIYKKLGVKDLLIWQPILDVFFYFYICINGLFNRNRKTTSWK